jgi:TIGR03009 family protein
MSRTLTAFSESTPAAVPLGVALACLTAALTLGPAGSASAQDAANAPIAANAANEARLNQLLTQWSQSSGRIQKLQGNHHRFVYDQVFQVEKRAEGVFYYEGPAKGRIDLKPVDVQGQKARRVGKDGKAYELKPDNAQRWICDGERIWQIDDATKQIDIYPIPPGQQGANIMDGPLPFLFGMPPDKAKARYSLTLIKEDAGYADIVAKPKRPEDAANWSEAKIRLDTRLFIPQAVQLIAPAGNLETVYTFDLSNLKIADNTGRDDFKGGFIRILFPEEDPFHPEIPKAYKVKVHQPVETNVEQPANVVPQVVNFPWKDAGALLEKAGCQVEYLRGPAPPRPQLEYIVAGQEPPAGTPLKPGLVVKLTVFDKAPAPPVGILMPNVTGQYWKKAGEALTAAGITEAAGFTVKYEPGAAPPTEKQLYEVYEQTPQPGQAVPAGSEITLRVYNAPKTAEK